MLRVKQLKQVLKGKDDNAIVVAIVRKLRRNGDVTDEIPVQIEYEPENQAYKSEFSLLVEVDE